MFHTAPHQFAAAGSAAARLPIRPDGGILNESIPLFFVGRNAQGLWVAREAEGRAGGIFLSEQSARRFAHRRCAPGGCATMTLPHGLELDVANEGGIAAALFALVHASLHRRSGRMLAGTAASRGRLGRGQRRLRILQGYRPSP